MTSRQFRVHPLCTLSYTPTPLKIPADLLEYVFIRHPELLGFLPYQQGTRLWVRQFRLKPFVEVDLLTFP